MRRNNREIIKRLRLSALSLLAAASLLCLSACSAYKPIEPDAEDLTVVGQVEGMDVYMDELRFVTRTYIDMMTDRYGEDIFVGEDAEEYVKLLTERVFSGLTANYAVVLLCEEALIRRGEVSIMERVEERMEQTVEAMGGMRSYKKYLKENFLTDRLLRFTTEVELMQSELMYVYTDDILVIEDDDEKLYDIIKEEFILVRHLFIPRSEEDAEAKIADAKAKIEAGATLTSLMGEYCRDPDMTADGLFILRGYMTPEYEETAFALKVGEVSDIFEDDSGYYVAERAEVTALDIMLRFDHLKQLYQTYAFYSILDEKQAELTFVPNDKAYEYVRAAVSKR